MAKKNIYTAVLVTVLLALSSQTVCSQTYKPYHDASVYNIFQEIEVETKIANRSLYNVSLSREPEYAEAVDSMLTKRLKDLLIETGDRVFDAPWLTERSKIEGQLDIFQRNLNLIRTYGGSEADYNYWKRIYNMIAKTAVSVIHDTYQPGYKRMEEYQGIYDDLLDYNSRLKDCLRYWEALRLQESVLKSQGRVRTTRLDSIAGICLGQWRLKAQSAISSSPKPKKLRNVWAD